MKTTLITNLRFLLVGLLLGFGTIAARGQDSPSPRVLLAWLNGLTLEARLDLERGDGSEPRLFTQTIPDGRTWMRFIADGFAGLPGADWAVADEAAGLLLAEAKHLDTLTEEASDPQQQQRLRASRKNYLQGAAWILSHYATATNEVYDDTLALIPNPLGLPDWVLPGEIQIKEAAGSARLNTATGDFAGRLSGVLALPDLETSLTVPNLSFDSKGNIDLTAYGQTSFPAGDPDGVLLTIPPRRPLTFHLADDGDFSVAGGLRLEFPDGNKVEGYFDIEDPMYEFGLSFEGSATLELAKEVTLLRPTIDPTTVYSTEAIDGFAQFFGAFGRGMETFLEDSPDLPSTDDLNVGVPPEFDIPETAVPFDILDAWLTGLANDEVRPILNAPADNAVAEVEEMLKGLKGGIFSARREVAPTLNEIRRLRRLTEANARVAEIAKRSKDEFLLGNQDDSDRLLAEAGAAALEAQDIAKEYVELLPGTAPFKNGLAAVGLYIEADRASFSLGGPGLETAFVNTTVGKIDQWAATALATYGFALDGSVLDQAAVDALRPEDLRMLLLFSVEVHKLQTSLSSDPDFSPLPTPLMVTLGTTELAKVKALYQNAIADDDEASRALNAVRLADLGSVNGALGLTDENADLLLMAGAVEETFTTIAGPNPTPARDKLAWQIIEAARRNQEVAYRATKRRGDELSGRAEGSEAFSERVEFSFVEQPFIERWYRGLVAVSDAGVIDAARSGELELNLASFMKFFAKAQTERFTDATLIEQNLDDAYTALLVLTDLVAIAEDMLPGDPLIGELQTDWEALHVALHVTGSIAGVPITEARRLHWYLAEYAKEIAAASTRYGDGLSAALQTAYNENGSEAIAGLSRVIDYLTGVVGGLGTEEFQFALPGDLEVQRLSGQLAFNRLDGSWALGFGGRVAFPDINAFFEIEKADLFSTGEFNLSLLTGGPVPFGLLDAASLDVATAFTMDGNILTPVIRNANADAVFTITPDVGDPIPYDVSFDYSFLNPDHKFEVRASFADNTELFSPEIVLFSGGFGFDLQTNGNGDPSQAGADVMLTAGVLKRPEAIAEGKLLGDLTPDDFYLQFIGAGGLDYYVDENNNNEEILSLNIAAGTTLILPRDVFSPSNDPADVAMATLGTDLCVQYKLDTGEISFCDVAGDPVRIEFNNIFLAVPGLADLSVDIIRADLLLSGTDFPVLTDLTAILSLPLPDDDPALVSVNNGEFHLDGFPTGEITLLNNVTLFEANGFSFTLLGNGNALCQEPTSLTIADVDPDPLVSTPRVEMSGAVRFNVPADILQIDTTGDNTISTVACGAGFILEAGMDPQITLQSLTIDGTGTDFIFAGEGGLRIGNPRLVLDNVDQLWSPDGNGIFSLTISGNIAVDGVGGFALRNATFEFPRGQLPNFNLEGVSFSVGESFAVDINFPSGAGFVHENGESFLEFGVIDIDFSEDSPIQLIGELNFTDNGQNRRLSLNHFTFDDLVNALALDPGDGIGVKIYDYLTAIWYGGTLTDGGIVDASFSITSEELPLPDSRITIPILSFKRGEPVKFAFYGDFDLKDLTPTPTTVRVPPNRPIWLEVSPTSLRLGGRVELMMEGGTTLAGELLLDDPYYAIKIEADGITIPLADELSDLLPLNPGNCLPTAGTETDASLDTAATCLKTYSEAYANFAATVAGASVLGADPAAAPAAEPPGPFNSAVSILEAWSWSALAPTANSMPIQNLATYFDFSCDATAGTQDAETVIRYLLALKRAKQAIQDGALTPMSDEAARLDAAIADAEQAAIARAQDPAATASLKSLDQALGMLLEIEAINQAIGDTTDANLLGTHLPKLLDRGTEAYFASLGVQPGQFLPDTNPAINEMNRFVAFETLRDLLNLMAKAALLTIDGQVSGPLQEALTQLAHHFYDLNQLAMDEAFATDDIRAYQYALEDLLELESLRALAVFPDHPSLTMLPNLTDLGTYAQQLAEMFFDDLDRPYGDRSYRNQLITLRGLLNILEEMPAGVTFVAAPFQKAFDRMDEALDDAVQNLALNERCDELALMIEAGLVHSRLAARFGIPLQYDWDGPAPDSYLARMVARFVTIAETGKCWSQLHEAACLLIAESQLDALEPNLPRRRAYLENAVTLVNTARVVGVNCWNDEETRRNANPALEVADMILPGDIYLDDVAGSARYNRRSGEFGAALSGTMTLPNFDSTFTLNRASFTSGGAFEINAFGQVPFGDAATLTVSERRPLVVSFAPPNDFSLSGGASITMDSGMQFEAHLSIDDPQYSFGASMTGVRFDLANEMTLYLPDLSDPTEIYPEEQGRILADYFESLGGTLETVADQTLLSPPTLGDPGTPPDFTSPTLDDPLQPLELWINSAQKDIARLVNNDYSGTFDLLREQLGLLGKDLQVLTSAVKNLDAIATRNRSLRRATETLQQITVDEILGNDPNWFQLRDAVAEAIAAARCLMDIPANQENLWRANRTARAVLDAAAADAVIGGDDPILSELVVFYDGVLTNVLTDYGFDASGNLTNPAALDGFTRDELSEITRTLLDTLATFLEMSGPPREAAVFAAAETLLFLRRSQVITALRNVGADDYGTHMALAKELLGVASTAELAGFTYPASGDLLTGGTGPINLANDIQDAVAQMELALDKQRRLERSLAANPSKRFLRDLVEALDKAGTTLSNDVQAYLDQQVERRANELVAFISEDWPAGRIRDGLGALEELAEVLAWLEHRDPADARLATFQTDHLPDLTSKFTGAAQAQKAWWLLGRYTEMLYDASLQQIGGNATVLQNAFRKEAGNTIRTAKALTDSLQMDLLPTRPVEIALPGDLVIESAFGEVFFDRSTQFFSGSFGGRVSFPEAGFYFEIIELTVNSNGELTISLRTAGQIPFGDSSQVNFEINPLSGMADLAGNLALGGMADFEFLDPADPTNPTPVSMTASWDNAENILRFTSTVSNLALVDDLALLGGSLAAEISTNSPNGAITVDGTVGLLARVKPLPNRPLVPSDFHLTATIFPTTFTYSPTELTATFTGGEIFLPADIFGDTLNGALVQIEEPPGSGQFVNVAPTITIAGELGIAYDLTPGVPRPLSFTGDEFRVELMDIGIQIPGLDGSLIAVTFAEFLLSGNDFPVLTSFDGTLAFPLPGIASPNPPFPANLVLNVTGENWRVDGWPDQASITLGQTLRILDTDSFAVDLIGANNDPASAAVIEFIGDPDLGPPSISFTAALRGIVDGELLWDGDAGEGASFQSGISVQWQLPAKPGDDFTPPTFDLLPITVGGNFNLGGENGLTLKGSATSANPQFAEITFVNPLNIFQRSPDNPFEVQITGALDIANFIEFGIDGASFIWDDQDLVFDPVTEMSMPVPRVPSNNLLPRFTASGAYAALGDEAIDIAEGLLPFYPTLIGFKFDDESLPLFPTGNEIGLFDLTNITAILSGVVNLPNASATDAGSPGLFGAVDRLEIGFVRQNGLTLPDLSSIDLAGFCLGIENLDLPPLGGITGTICVKNLNALPDITQLYFAGQAGAKINDVGASVLLAAKPTEFIGACFELNAGPAGIPLDGGTLGGILLTGGRGGINFKNSFSDPCDFASYVEADTSVLPGDGPPTEPSEFTIPDGFAGGPLNCLTSPFPPKSRNPLCEEFPVDSGRFIFKGTQVDPPQAASFLAGLGITPTSLVDPITGRDLTIDQAIEIFVTSFSGNLETQFNNAVNNLAGAANPFNPPVDPDNPVSTEEAEFFAQIAGVLKESFDDAATSILKRAFEAAIEGGGQMTPYEILLQQVTQGIPCFDFTLLLGGTISHSAVSTVLTGSGNVTLSSTGTMVFDGSINLIGIPVATGELAFILTDENGDVDPAFGGAVNVALGPLDLAKMTASISCRGCFNVVATAFANLLACQGAALGPAATEFAYQMMEASLGREFLRTTGLADHFLNSMNTQEQLAYLGSFFNYFQALVSGSDLPALRAPDGMPVLDVDGNPVAITLDPADLGNFRDCFTAFVIEVFPEVNPFICFSGEIGPKLFGFPLTGGADTLFGGSLLYGRVEENGEQFQELIASTEFSPTFMMLAPVLGTYSAAIPAIDTATLGFSARFNAPVDDPDMGPGSVQLLLNDPGAFAISQFDTLVSDAVLSFSYSIEPLGINMADGQGRMIMPRREAHPANTSRSVPVPLEIDPDQWETTLRDNRYGGNLYGKDLDDFILAQREARPPVTIDPDRIPSNGDEHDVVPYVLPTRRELILTALSKGQLKNPRWRGNNLDLLELFLGEGLPADPMSPDAPGYTPSSASCDQLNGEVTEALLLNDATLAELKKRTLPNDYFPHGGLIAGAEIAFPNVLANEIPFDLLTRFFTVPNLGNQADVDEWLLAAQHLFADQNGPEPIPDAPGFAYFTGTDCVGQMALYLPAPNPIIPDPETPGEFQLIDFETTSLSDMMAAIKPSSFQTAVEHSDAFFDDGEILLTGWLHTKLFGMPVARGQMDYFQDTKTFQLNATIDEGTWLNQWVGGSLDVIIAPPDNQKNSLDPEGATERFNRLAAAFFPNPRNPRDPVDLKRFDFNAFFAEAQQAMPKMSFEADANFMVPGGLTDLFDLGAGITFFGYSPSFLSPGDPGYDLSDQSPLAIAQRRGGIGVSGDFRFGYFPRNLDPSQQLIIDVANASMAVFPNSDSALFPSFAGQLEVNKVVLPGAFNFANVTGEPFTLGGLDGNPATLTVNSDPDLDADYFSISGGMSDIDMGPFLQVTAMRPATSIGGSLHVTKTGEDRAGNPEVGIRLALEPAEATIPLLGNVTGRIFGGDLDEENLDTSDMLPIVASLDQNADFTFSTVPGQDWSAIVQLDGALEIRNPFDLASAPFATLQPVSQDNGSGPQQIPFLAELHGTGLEFLEIRLTIPNGVEIRFFPDTPYASTMVVGDESATCLLINTEGRIYFDSGTRELELALPTLKLPNGDPQLGPDGLPILDPAGAPLASVTGRIEFGFEPFDRAPGFDTSRLVPFTAALGSNMSQTLTVTNDDPNGGLLEVDASIDDPTHFSVQPNRLLVPPGQSADLTILYQPKTAGTHNPRLLLSTNSAQPSVEFPLPGSTLTAPEVELAVTSIDFGLTPLGTTKGQAVTIANTGTASLRLTSITTSGAPFIDNRSTLVIPPSETRTITVSFTPTSTAVANGTLTFDTDDSSEPAKTITLTGRGSDRFWYHQRRGDGAQELRDVGFSDNSEGFAMGRQGAFLTATDEGRAWRKGILNQSPDAYSLAIVDDNTSYLAGTLLKLTPANSGSMQGLVLRSSNGGTSWSRLTDTVLDGNGYTWRAAAIIPGATPLLCVGGDFIGSGRIVTEQSTGGFQIGDIRGGSQSIRGISFGTSLIGLAVGPRKTVLITRDAGKSWNPVTSIPASIPDDTDFNAVAANPFDTDAYVIVGENGTILRTLDNGGTWEIKASGTTEDLHAVTRPRGNRFFAFGDNGTILLGQNAGSSWVQEDALTTEDFRGAGARNEGTTAVANEVWAVTSEGSIFHRQNTAITGPIAVMNSDLQPGNRSAEGELMVGETRITNEGVSTLTVAMSSSNRDDFTVSPGGTQTVDPGVEVVFTVAGHRANSGSYGTTLDITSSDPVLDKQDDILFYDNRFGNHTRLGYLSLPGRIDLGTIILGNNGSTQVVVTNVGDALVNLHSVELRHDHDDTLFEATTTFNRLDPGKNDKIPISFSPTTIGSYRGTLEIASDARNGLATVEIVAEVVKAPEVVIVETDPPGLNFILDHDDNGIGTIYSNTTAFTVVDGPPANNRQIRRGDSITTIALASTTKNSQSWTFQRWLPGTTRTFSFIAGQSVSRFTAKYAVSPLAAPAPTDPPTLAASPCLFNPPNDVSQGPWVKISEAKLTLPWLGDGTVGSEFGVEGALFMSATRAYGSLSSSSIRIEVPDNFPQANFRGTEILEVTPGGWSFDINTAGTFSLASLTPGISVLGVSGLPPTDLMLAVDLNNDDDERSASLSFATLDDLPVIPGILAIGPGAADLEIGLKLSQPDLFFSLNGSIRALAEPGNPDNWLIERPYSFTFDPALPDLGPYVFTTQQDILNLGVVKIRSNNTSTPQLRTVIGPSFDGTDFSLLANNFKVQFFDSPTNITASISASSNGNFTFNTSLVTGVPTEAGVIEIMPSGPDGTVSIVTNPLQALLQINFPGIEINSSGNLWPDGQIELPAFSFDSDGFTKRVPIPNMDFSSFDLDPSAKSADNYFQIKRTATASSIKLRNKQDLILGRLKLGLDLSSSGNLSGSLAGELGIEEPSPFNAFNDRVSLQFDKGNSPEFQLSRYFLGVAGRLQFGSSSATGGQACLLIDRSPDPLIDWPTGTCFPAP